MRARLLIIILAAVLLFGCIGEEKFAEIKKEKLLAKNEYDLDGDGLWDYAVYDFSPVKMGDQTEIHRIVGVARVQTAAYTNYRNTTDLDLMQADSKLSDFSVQKMQAEDFCSRKLGLSGVKCVETGTCTRVCAANSEKCRILADSYGDALGGSILAYGKDASSIDSNVVTARNAVVQLRSASPEKKALFLDYVMEMKNTVAALNANPLVFTSPISLCEASDYGAANLNDAAKTIGTYNLSTSGYRYSTVLEIKAINSKPFSKEIIGSELSDVVPVAVSSGDVSSYQRIATEKGSNGLTVKWATSSLTDKGYLLVYSFQSTTAPDELATALNVATVKTRYADISVLQPINGAFMALYGLTGNHYFAAGIVAGVVFAVLMLLFTLVAFGIQAAEYKLGGRKLADAVKKAFGRTAVRWRISIPTGILLLVIAFVVAVYMAPEPFAIKSIMDLAKIDMGNMTSQLVQLAGFGLAMGGIILIYDGLENLAKITLLERYYGLAVRGEREGYMGKILRLKETYRELRALVEQYQSEDFDVSAEYSVVTSISAARINSIEKKMTADRTNMLDEYLGKVESALDSLKERKKLADDNWTKWNEAIEKALAERNEVSSTVLMGIPASLRSWALAKYVKEHSDEELVFEKDMLKRKKMTLKMLLKEMAKDGLLKGGIVIKNEVIASSYFEGDKSATVQSALLFKLRAYMHSLGKAMALGESDSYVAVGDKNVFALTTVAGYGCALFIPREKFQESYAKWKDKMKTISE
ncbi:MAG: hypothetical protein V1492_04040 [Candidatus Micrarchaeota archaeon]